MRANYSIASSARSRDRHWDISLNGLPSNVIGATRRVNKYVDVLEIAPTPARARTPGQSKINRIEFLRSVLVARAPASVRKAA
jgi:hypothetical protein